MAANTGTKMADIEFSESPSGGKFFISDYAEITFSKSAGNSISIDHTGVSPDHRGEGLAQDLYHFMIKYARKNKLTVIPACSFAEKMFADNPKDRDLLA